MNENIRKTLYGTIGAVACSLLAKKTGLDQSIGMVIGLGIGTILATETKRPINGVKRVTKCGYVAR